MLRDSQEAFEHFARLRFEHDRELREHSTEENHIQAGDATRSEQETQNPAGDPFLPRSANGAEFVAIGRILYPFWYNVEHATLDVRKAKKEVRRWERSIAFLDDADVPDVSESKVIEDMLELAERMLKIENMRDIRNALSKMFEPLEEWSARVIRIKDEHDKIHYAIAKALLCVSGAMVRAGLSGLGEDQQKYITECKEAAGDYVFFVDNRESLEEDDHDIATMDDCPLFTFPKLLCRETPAGILSDHLKHRLYCI